MTTPGGVPNLPAAAMTLDTLAEKLQDMSGSAMKSRAVERFPGVFNGSTGLDPSLDITPFGILTRIWAQVNSLIANADPADIDGPEDLPPLVLDFIEGIPVVGQFVELLEAIAGHYDGHDPVLVAVQNIFSPIRTFMQLVTGRGEGFPTPQEVVSGWDDFINKGINDVQDFLNGLFNVSATANQFPPYDIPFTPIPARLSDAQRFIVNLKRFLSFDILSSDFNPADALTHFIGTVPGFNNLTSSVQKMIDDTVSTWTGVISSGNPITAFFDAIFGIHGTGTVAQKSADSANVGVAMLIAKGNAEAVPGGVLIHDTFDRVGTTMGPDYVTHYFESGGGSWRTANDNLHWVNGDANPRSVHSRRVEALATDYQSGQIVQDAILKDTNVQDRTLIILLRQNAAQTRSVLATIRGGTVELGCWVDGTYTRFGAVATVPNAAGDRWELWAGTLGNVREFVLFRNGNEALRRTDTGAVSYYGSDYRYPGPGARAGVYYTGVPPFATYSQASPPDLQSFDASDRVAA